MLMAATRISAAMRIMTVDCELAYFSLYWNGLKEKKGVLFLGVVQWMQDMCMKLRRCGQKFKQKLTNPFQILPMARPYLIFQHRQQIRNHIQPLRQQPHPLIHFEVAAHGNIHRLQLRFGPH